VVIATDYRGIFLGSKGRAGHYIVTQDTCISTVHKMAVSVNSFGVFWQECGYQTEYGCNCCPAVILILFIFFIHITATRVDISVQERLK
jgi:hypothetical protein